MEIIRFIIAGIIGTSVMTLFSYIVSSLRNKDFREPELLNILVNSYSVFSLKPKKNSLIGWFIHYGIGFLMLFLIMMVFRLFDVDINFYSSLIIGIVAGAVGVFGWQILFILSPRPPEIEIKKFYLHLIIAHVFFATSSLGVLFYMH